MDSITAAKLNNFLTNSLKNQETLKDVVLAIRKRIPQQSSQELLEKWNAIYGLPIQRPLKFLDFLSYLSGNYSVLQLLCYPFLQCNI